MAMPLMIFVEPLSSAAGVVRTGGAGWTPKEHIDS
jgi:hypothetical protein